MVQYTRAVQNGKPWVAGERTQANGTLATLWTWHAAMPSSIPSPNGRRMANGHVAHGHASVLWRSKRCSCPPVWKPCVHTRGLTWGTPCGQDSSQQDSSQRTCTCASQWAHWLTHQHHRHQRHRHQQSASHCSSPPSIMTSLTPSIPLHHPSLSIPTTPPTHPPVTG